MTGSLLWLQGGTRGPEQRPGRRKVMGQAFTFGVDWSLCRSALRGPERPLLQVHSPCTH